VLRGKAIKRLTNFLEMIILADFSLVSQNVYLISLAANLTGNEPNQKISSGDRLKP
jgi:hypothetical protein